MPPLAGHQPDPLDPKHPANGFELGPQGLELQVDQVRAMQVDRIAMLAAHFATGHVDAVLHQQVEDIPKDADAVLAMDFDAHGEAHRWKSDGKRHHSGFFYE
ncbi:hypothetical protein D3C84_270430 [compost metagenome]